MDRRIVRRPVTLSRADKSQSVSSPERHPVAVSASKTALFLPLASGLGVASLARGIAPTSLSGTGGSSFSCKSVP